MSSTLPRRASDGRLDDRLDERLDEVVRACEAIERYADADAVEPTEIVLDAIRMRLVEIGAIVATLPADLTAAEPGIPWSRLARVGERLTGRGRAISSALLRSTARSDVPRLREAVERLRSDGAGPADGTAPTANGHSGHPA